LLGPATNVATLAWLRKAYGGRAMLWALVGLLGITWSLAFVANRVLADTSAQVATAAAAHEHNVIHHASLALLLLLLARAVWRNGLRSWLGSLGEALALEPASHAHSHGEHAHGAHAHGIVERHGSHSH
jgi:hypothetical protein